LAARNPSWRFVAGIVEERRPPAGVATAFEKLAMHVKNMSGSGFFVQVVHVLRAEEEAIFELAFQAGKREMSGIGLGDSGNAPAHGVEIPDQRRIPRPGMRGRHFFDAIVAPESARSAKGWDTTFGTDA
jgi:hypothetical protein